MCLGVIGSGLKPSEQQQKDEMCRYRRDARACWIAEWDIIVEKDDLASP